MGWLTGAWVISGHAALEGILLCGLVFGVVEFLHAPIAAKIIGVVGAALLLYMGVGLIREVFKGRALALSTGKAERGPAAGPPAEAARDANGAREGANAGARGPVSGLNPVLAGALISMSNPYWWIWWVTIGSALLVKFDVSMEKWQGLLAFFLGHELGDLGWYMAVSVAIHFGGRAIPRGVLAGLLTACGVVIIGFGAYLGVSPFLPK
jgi:threonine/homoserine/homoserine lactone efflux protein